DVVEKEMYTFEDRGGRSVSLRPENTASCVRAAIQHGLFNSPLNRIWYIGPMFRYERQQANRYRQFHQIGAEIYGASGAEADAEVILLTARLWRELGLEGLRLELNSLGNRDEQQAYRAQLVAYLQANESALDEDSKRRLRSNPLRVLDSKNPQLQSLIEAAPAPLDSLQAESRTHFETVCQTLRDCGLDPVVNRRLVRGLDYYTRTVFEWTNDSLGAQTAVCGGGRYDQLVTEIGGPDTPAVGFSVGIERLVAVTLAQQQDPPADRPTAYLAAVGERPQMAAHALAERLRDRLPELRIVVDAGAGSFKAKLRRADRSGARFALIVGDSELEQHSLAIKDLERKDQQTVGVDDVAGHLRALLA
ncbi:MAG: histidine--tRNA ligase, partial [Gammaproteobacteria bacterium]|nr:histidine--tRNA ligase [Gammaproteobacteria bacterium]